MTEKKTRGPYKKRKLSKAKPLIKYSTRIGEFICQEVASGKTIAQVCREHDDMPHPSTIYRWKSNRPIFAEMLDKAYESFIQAKIDEIEYLSTTSLDILYPNQDFRAANENRRSRMSALTLMVTKVSALLSKKYDKATKVEHSGEVKGNNTQIIIQDYSKVTAESARLSKKEQNSVHKKH